MYSMDDMDEMGSAELNRRAGFVDELERQERGGLLAGYQQDLCRCLYRFMTDARQHAHRLETALSLSKDRHTRCMTELEALRKTQTVRARREAANERELLSSIAVLQSALEKSEACAKLAVEEVCAAHELELDALRQAFAAQLVVPPSPEPRVVGDALHDATPLQKPQRPPHNQTANESSAAFFQLKTDSESAPWRRCRGEVDGAVCRIRCDQQLVVDEALYALTSLELSMDGELFVLRMKCGAKRIACGFGTRMERARWAKMIRGISSTKRQLPQPHNNIVRLHRDAQENLLGDVMKLQAVVKEKMNER